MDSVGELDLRQQGLLTDQKNCGGSSFAGIATKMDRYCGRLALGLEVMKYGCKESKLEENGNGLPEFDLDLVTAFLVKEKISPRGMEAKLYAIEQGYLVEENEKKN